MRQKDVEKLLSLLSNYVIKASKEYPLEDVTDDIARYLDLAARASTTPLSYGEKKVMYEQCVAALNCGSDEAERDAFEIRLKALCSGDEELIEKIEYLHEVL